MRKYSLWALFVALLLLTSFPGAGSVEDSAPAEAYAIVAEMPSSVAFAASE